jgi:hypothetical protein
LNADYLDGQHGSFYASAASLSSYVPTSRTLTINGTTFDLSANRSWTIAAGTGTVTQVNSGNGMSFSNFTTSGTITMGTPSSTTLASANATTTNSHTHAFAPGGTTAQYITGAGTLVTFPTITNGTVTSVAALTLGTTGTDLSSTVANGTTTPVITLNVPTASATNRGVLSSANWTTFNNKQAQLNGTGFVKAVGTTISYDNSTYYLASNPNGYTTNVGTVTSVSGTGTVNGITLIGNITSSGVLTLGGTLGNIANSQLQNSSIQIGTTVMSLGTAYASIAGLSSVSSTSFTGNLTGTASLATSATTALNSTQLNGQLASFYYPASNPNGYTTNTGTVTGVNSGNGMNFTNFSTSGTITLGTPSSTTLASTNAVTGTSHTHAFAPGGTAAQYITGAGTLVTFPTIPTVGNGTLSMATSGIATGSASFTANQSGNSTFTVNVPATNLSIGVSSGTAVRVDSSTGTNADLPVASATLAGVLSSANWTTFNNKQPQLNGTGFVKAVGTTISYDNSSYYLASNPNGYTTNTGTVTAVNKGNGMDFTNFSTSGTITLGTPSSTTLASANAVTTSSHTHAFAPGGTTAQYITGAGTLVTFPTIPTVGNGTLTLATSGIATGSASFTANQSAGSTFTVNVPATNLSIGSSTGTVVRVDSSTGTNATLPVASATLAGVITNTTQTIAGIKTFTDTITASADVNASGNLTAGANVVASAYGRFSSALTGDRVFIGDPFSVGPVGVWDNATQTGIAVYDVAGGVFEFANREIRVDINTGYVCVGGGPSGAGKFEVLGDNGGGGTSIYASDDIVAFSDISVKENIRPIFNVLDRVVNSRGVVYDRIDSKTKNNIGFIAQELEEQFPELVTTNPDGTKAVKYQNATAVLFEAVKEQQKQIDSLQEQINNILVKLEK